MNELHKSVAKQLKEAKTKEEFDKLLNYHYGKQLDKYKTELEAQGVDFERFGKEEDAKVMDGIVVDNKNNNKKYNKKKEDIVNVAALTKMVIDQPLVEKTEDKGE